MTEIINISRGVAYDDSISKIEYHSYLPFLQSFGKSDEIRVSIQQQDLCILPSESFIYIEGYILTSKDKKLVLNSKLCNNGASFLFDEIRYELNGIEIDQNKNVGITSSLKNYISLTRNEHSVLENASWNLEGNILETGRFSYCIPLRNLLGFAEDYKKIITSARHELVLIRARTDDNAYFGNVEDENEICITKFQWRVPHVTLADSAKLSLLKTIQSNTIQISFRNWELYEYPVLPTVNEHVWNVKTSNQLEKPRYIILALQTNRKNKKNFDPSMFDHCNLSNVQIFLNSVSYPYETMALDFDKNQYALLYDMYTRFRQSYYNCRIPPLLSKSDFKSKAPICVIDCAHQSEVLKTAPVDVRIQIKANTRIPDSTSLYALLLHDRIVEYNAMNNDVRKLV